jgi:hypothetical protein
MSDKQEASAFPECRNYEELREQLGKLPNTWYPDLIRAMIEAAYRKKVFQIHGASTMIQHIEDQLYAGSVPITG